MTRYKETEMLKALFAGVDWSDIRRKVWHGALLAAGAWIAVNPEQAWVTPFLTHISGQSQPIGFVVPK